MQSCLVANLSHYQELEPGELELLAELERTERHYGPREEVHRESESRQQLRVVKRGWFYTYTRLPDGKRFIYRVHHPGDVLGMQCISFAKAATNLKSVNGGVLCPFPRSALHRVFGEAPRLAALLFSIAVREQVLLIDQLRAISRMSAVERVAHFLLELLCRLRVTDPGRGAKLTLPLNQSEIGDVLGLTNVYVSKTFRALERDELIARRGDELTLLDERRLRAMCDFVDRYADMETDWFDRAGRP